MATRIAKAMSMPPKPAKSMPKFQPEKSPEMTAATARPHRPQTPAARVSLRFSKYPDSAVVYFTPETLRVSFAMTAPLYSSREPMRRARGCDACGPDYRGRNGCSYRPFSVEPLEAGPRSCRHRAPERVMCVM